MTEWLQKHAFESFVTGDNVPEMSTKAGIGLHIVKNTMDLHHGLVTLKSVSDEGSIFALYIPEGKEHFAKDSYELIDSYQGKTKQNEELKPEPFLPIPENKIQETAAKKSLLIIEDNEDVREYIRSLFISRYAVSEACNGEEGVRIAKEQLPDLIISDVMMPGMDGVECCRRLKSELQTCHIPVILLTACSLDEQRIQGYDGGADSYISKPFNSQLLLSRVRNLIANRRQLRQFFGDNQTIEKEAISDLDKGFVSRFKSLVEERMKDAELNVEDLGRNMGMSRVQLYRKLKSLTNYSPNELLRQMRLKKAASLLASSDMTVAEIAYEVGFSSPSYFTKCYKEQFGESPTEFLKRRG